MNATSTPAPQTLGPEGFVYTGRSIRVVFGVGKATEAGREIQRLGLERVLLLATPEQRERALGIASALGSSLAGTFADARMHVPIEVAARAKNHARALQADGLLAIGGGSTIGLAKAIALDTNLPSVAIPTTYAGSEMTTIFGLTDGGHKRTGRDDRVLPKTVIYDPSLTLSLSAAQSAASGFNAIAHAVEALYAPDGNPIVSIMAEESIRALGFALERIVTDPRDIEARVACAYGAWLAGSALDSVTMALHHKLCHTLGGTFDLPHAQTHAVVLPYAAGFNASHAREAMARVARALGSEDAIEGLRELGRRTGVPSSLRELGMRECDLDRAADLAVAAPYPNPRPFDRVEIRELLARAYDGSAVAA